MIQRLTIIVVFLASTIAGCSQKTSDQDASDIKWARQEIRSAIADTTQHNLISSKFAILDTKEKAIKFAEQILFDVYGKKQIETERPYKAYLVDDYWVIGGTLHQARGGTFLIITNSHDCKILRLTHGK